MAPDNDYSTSYHEWLGMVDGIIGHAISLDHLDLSEQPWFEWWHKGVSSYDAAHMAMRADGWED